MRSALIALALLVTPALAQEPSEEVKRAALMRAYHLNGDSMVSMGSIDLSKIDVTDTKVECFTVLGEVTGKAFFECRQPVEAAPAVVAQAEPAAPAPNLDICKRHGLRKVVRGDSWRCRR